MQQQQTLTRRGRAVCFPLRAAFLLLICLVPAGPSVAQGNGVDAMCMLEEHNTLRATVGAPELRWSDALARQATAWAAKLKKEGCAMQHSRGTLGENLYWAGARKTGSRGKGKSGWSWSLAPQTITEKEVVAGWATEKQWYSRTTNSCNAPPGKTCGHYTQMTWEATREIGCGKAVCGDSSQIWVCNYAPAGNVAGQRPY